MTNTAIFKEDGIVINSQQCRNYSLLITDIGENFNQADYIPPTIQLITQTYEEVIISTFYEMDEACEALSTLLKAVQNGEREWDVRDYNSNV